MGNYGLLFKKTSTAKGAVDVEYLDEFSSKKSAIKSTREGIPLEDILNKKNDLYKSLSYLSKEEKGQVHAGGWVRNMILRKGGQRPEELWNEERKKLIREVMTKHTAVHGMYRGAHGHKLVFSLSNDLENKLDKAGIDKEYELKRIFKRVMKDFEKKFHGREHEVKFKKGDKNLKVKDMIGYAWGVHHDTDNLHIHCHLHNRTLLGKHVACSRPLANKKDLKPRANQIGFINEKLNDYEQALERKADRIITQQEIVTVVPRLKQLWEITKQEYATYSKPPKPNNRTPEDFNKIRLMNVQWKKLRQLKHSIDSVYRQAYYRGILRGVINSLDKNERKKKVEPLKKEYYKLLNSYQKNFDKFIIESLKAHSLDAKARQEYSNILKAFKSKKFKGEDYSKELEVLNQVRKSLNINSRFNKKGYLVGEVQRVEDIKHSTKTSKDLKNILHRSFDRRKTVNQDNKGMKI